MIDKLHHLLLQRKSLRSETMQNRKVKVEQLVGRAQEQVQILVQFSLDSESF